MENNFGNNNLAIHYICGMPRSGTTWMDACLQSHAACASLGETLYWGRGYIRPKNGATYDRNEVDLACNKLAEVARQRPNTNWAKLVMNSSTDTKCLMHDISQTSPKNLYLAFAERMSSYTGKSTLIDKTPHHVNWIPRILKNLPQSKFILMYRSPYEFVRSYKYQGRQTNALIRNVFEKQYHPLQAALVWRGSAKSILKHSESYPDKTLLVNNESLGRDDYKLMKKIECFLELPVDPSFGDAIAQPINSSVQGLADIGLAPIDIFWINLVAKSEIKSLGYEFKNTNVPIIDFMKSLVEIPLWAVRTIILLKKKQTSGLLNYLYRWIK